MMKTAVLISMLLACGTLAGCERPPSAGPSLLPRTQREMKSPGFWIARLADPDREVMSASGIAGFNERTVSDLGLIKDLAQAGPTSSGRDLAKALSDSIAGLSGRDLFLEDGKRAGSDFYRRIRDNLDLGSISESIAVRYGLVTRCADQRILPTDLPLSEKPGDLDFDELQNSSLDVSTPVVILHESKDGVWVYGDAPTCSGWTRKDDVAFCSREQFRDYVAAQGVAVVTSAKADIFLDKELKRYHDYARMGTKFPLKDRPEPGVVEVLLPGGSGYVHEEDVSAGFLKYTPRHVIEQAFKLLNAPYGWGGKDGEQDCSAFLQEIFAVFGIILPRNSSDQAKVGRFIAAFAKKTPLSFKARILDESAAAGITLLRFDGHIGLYLGRYEEGHYLIHETHGYQERRFWRSQSRILNRAVVSDLLLGKGSRKGSLLERLLDVRSVSE